MPKLFSRSRSRCGRSWEKPQGEVFSLFCWSSSLPNVWTNDFLWMIFLAIAATVKFFSNAINMLFGVERENLEAHLCALEAVESSYPFDPVPRSLK